VAVKEHLDAETRASTPMWGWEARCSQGTSCCSITVAYNMFILVHAGKSPHGCGSLRRQWQGEPGASHPPRTRSACIEPM